MSQASPKAVTILEIFKSVLTSSPFFLLGYRFINVAIGNDASKASCYMRGKTLYLNANEKYFPEGKGTDKVLISSSLLFLLSEFYCFMLGLVTSPNRSNTGLSHFCKFLVSYLQLITWGSSGTIFETLKSSGVSPVNNDLIKTISFEGIAMLTYTSENLKIDFPLKSILITEPKGKTWVELYDIIFPELPPEVRFPSIFGEEGDPGLDGEASEDAIAAYDKLIRNLHSSPDLIRGHHPGGQTDFLAPEIQEEKVDWRTILATIVYDLIEGGLNQSWRPYKWDNPAIQSLVRREDTSKYLGDIVVAIDTSGSMSHEDLNNAVSEIFHLLAQKVTFKLTVIQCDAQIQKVDIYESSMKPTIDVILDQGIKGRGGTSTIPVFNYCRENDIDVKALFYLTDMGIDYPNPFPVFEDRVYWFNTNKHHTKVEVPFGHIFDCH